MSINEKIAIPLTADITDFQKGINEARDDIKGFKERVKSEEAIKMSFDSAAVKIELANIKKLIKIAEKEGDLTAQIQFEAEAQRLQLSLTQAKRELNNFVRVWEKDVSVLGKLFSSVNSEIEKTRLEILKVGKDTSGLDRLEGELLQLNQQFIQGKLTAQQYGQQLDKINESVKNVNVSGGGLSGMFTKLTGYIALVTGAFYTMKSALDESIQGEAEFTQLENKIRNVWDVTKQTTEEIQKLVEKLNIATTIDAGDITQGAISLLNYTNIAKENFDDLLGISLDLATWLNGGLTPSVWQITGVTEKLGKALNNPFEGFQKLEKIGISFTAEEQRKIKELEKTNKTFEAQQLILWALQSKYSGTAEAIADTNQGTMNKIKNFTNDALEFLWNQAFSFLNFITWVWKTFFNLGAVLFTGLVELVVNSGKTIVNFSVWVYKNFGALQSGVKKVFSNIGAIVSVFGDNIPEYLKAWLNKVPWLFASAFNKALEFIPDKIKTALGWKPLTAGDSKIFSANIKKYPELVGDAFAGVDFGNIVPDGFFKHTEARINDLIAWVKNLNKETTKTAKATPTLNFDAFDDPGADKKGGGKKSGLDDQKKKLEELKKKEEERKKKIEELGAKNKTVYEGIVSDIEKTIDKMGDYIDKIVESKKKIKDFGDEASNSLRDVNNELDKLNSKTGENLANRGVKAQEELQKLLDSQKNTPSGVLDMAGSLSKETLTSVGKWVLYNAGDTSFTGEDILKIKDDLETIKKLKEEIALVESNTSDDQRKTADETAKMSEAQKILNESVADKKVLEEKLAIYEAIKNGQKINMDELTNYDNIKLAEQLTAKQVALETELNKQIQNYELQKQALITYNEERKTFETQYTQFFGQEVDKQIAIAERLKTVLRSVIELQRQAGTSGISLLNAQGQKTAASTSVTNANRTVEIKQLNVNNNVDVDYAIKKIWDKIQ